jgi:hypothetical protein
MVGSTQVGDWDFGIIGDYWQPSTLSIYKFFKCFILHHTLRLNTQLTRLKGEL